MKSYDARRVINGTYGELWLNSDYVAEVVSFESKIAFTKQAVNQVQQFMEGVKIIGGKGTGSIKLNKVTSRMHHYLGDCIKKGVFEPMTVISNLKDPDAFGAERVKLSGVLFDDLTLASWEAAKTGEVTLPFTFTDFTPIDLIEEL